MRWDVTCTLITFRFQEVLVLFTKPTLRSFQTGFPKSTIVTFAPYFVTFGWSKRDLRGLRGVKWWSDLGEKLNPYAFHHSQHNSQEFDKDIYSIMTGFDKAKERLENLKEEREILEKGEEREVGGSPHQQFLWGQIKKIEEEIEFLEDLLDNFYNFE